MGTIDRTFTESQDQRSLTAFRDGIDQITRGAELNEAPDSLKSITRNHWKDLKDFKLCQNRQCRKTFSLIDWPHHCYRCGAVFCSNCLKFKRRLNDLACPDPDGKLYKVCQPCFEEGKIVEGFSRSWTSHFRSLRNIAKFHRQISTEGQKSKSRRDRINFDVECRRLTEGFQASIGTSEVKRPLAEMRSLVSLPDWQKSTTWLQESMADACHYCRRKFGLLRTKCCCRVCGLAVCRSCTDKDLLVYIPDDLPEDQPPQPRLAIIRIQGAPVVEPESSLSLRVCGTCRDILIDRQLAALEREEVVGEDFLSCLQNLHLRFSRIKDKVKQQLPEYQEIVDSLEDNSRGSSGADPQKSNIKLLAKAQGDLADYLAELAISIQLLKRLDPKTGTQTQLLKNYIQSNCSFYLDNVFMYRLVRRKWSDVCPPDLMAFIQNAIDKNAIISTHLYLLQLGYETMHLSGKYGLPVILPTVIAPVEELVKGEVKTCLARDGESWEEHQNLTQSILKSQLKGHKLIRPSKRQLEKKGAEHVAEVMNFRTRQVISQITLQLQLKSANRQFPGAKKALEEVSEALVPEV